jgi:CheY-like chemotaxis protein
VILVVDDYWDSAEVLCSLLTHQGYPCQWAGSGHEALALMRSHPPELPLLVVLDDMMPEMSGLNVLKAIRADPKLKGTTVVMYSAGFDVGNRDQALVLGAAAWLLKGGAEGTTLDTVIASIVKWYLKVGGVSSRSTSDSKSGDPRT